MKPISKIISTVLLLSADVCLAGTNVLVRDSDYESPSSEAAWAAIIGVAALAFLGSKYSPIQDLVKNHLGISLLVILGVLVLILS